MQPYFDALKQQEILQSTGLVTTKPFQVFTVFMQVGFLGGLGVSLPAIYFNELLGLQMIWTASDYFNILLWMVLGIGLSFEFPLVLVVLVFVGILSRAQLAKAWRLAFATCFIAAAVITPTGDPITMSLVAAPLFVLYLGAVFVAGFIEKKQASVEEDED